MQGRSLEVSSNGRCLKLDYGSSLGAIDSAALRLGRPDPEVEQ